MKQQSNEGDDDEENADVEKKQSHSKLTNLDDTINDADVEMADNVKNSDNETNTAGDTECQEKHVDSSDAKTATDSGEPTTVAAAISKALLNIISNFTTDIFIFLF